MQTSLSHSRLYRPLLSERKRGVCTLFPPHGGKLSQLCNGLGDELHEILQRLCSVIVLVLLLLYLLCCCFFSLYERGKRKKQGN